MNITRLKKIAFLLFFTVVLGGLFASPKPSLLAEVLVEGGSFEMGSNDGKEDEKPVRKVTVDSFFMGQYEVTQKQWFDVMGSLPEKLSSSEKGVGDNHPIYDVSWYDAVKFCNVLSYREGLDPCYLIKGESVSCDFTKSGYRLPTEAEWEYVARGGKHKSNFTYSGSNDLDVVGWDSSNSAIDGESPTHLVGTKKANTLGLYDMTECMGMVLGLV